MENILVRNFARHAATRIYSKLEDNINQLKGSYVKKINVPTGKSSKYSENRVICDSRYCNGFNAFSKDFTIDWLYKSIIQALKNNNVISEENGENEILQGNTLIAAMDIMIRFVQQYVKTFSTRTPNDQKQITLPILSRSGDIDGQTMMESIDENLSSDVFLDYDMNDIKSSNVNMIQKVPIQGLFGNLAKEIDRSKHFFLRYSITTYDS